MQKRVFLSILLFFTLIGTAQAETVYFLVGEINPFHGDSYVLPLSNPADIAHARDLIEYGLAAGEAIVVATIDRSNPDGLNRDYLKVPPSVWSWRVDEFLGFADITAEILDGWPTGVEESPGGWPSGSTIGFWSYTVVAELEIEIDPEPEVWNCDLNLDGSINFSDFSIVAGQWLEDVNGPADIDGSNTVDNLDLAILADHWLNVTLVGWWKFDDDANDSFGNNDGTIYGDPCFVTGQIDGALDFNGLGDYVNIVSPSFNLATHTTSFWIKPGTLGYKIAIEPVKGTTRAFGYIGLSGEGQVRHYVRSGILSSSGKIDAQTANLVEVDSWYHIVSIMGVAGNKLYVNGTQQTLSYLNGSPSSTEGWAIIDGGNGPNNLNIGSHVYDGVGNNFFDGIIDDVRIYNRALSAGDVQQLYQDGL